MHSDKRNKSQAQPSANEDSERDTLMDLPRSALFIWEIDEGSNSDIIAATMNYLRSLDEPEAERPEMQNEPVARAS